MTSQLHAPDTLPKVNSSRYALRRGQGGPQGHPGRFSCQKTKSSVFQPVDNHYTNSGFYVRQIFTHVSANRHNGNYAPLKGYRCCDIYH